MSLDMKLCGTDHFSCQGCSLVHKTGWFFFLFFFVLPRETSSNSIFHSHCICFLECQDVCGRGIFVKSGAGNLISGAKS